MDSEQVILDTNVYDTDFLTHNVLTVMWYSPIILTIVDLGYLISNSPFKRESIRDGENISMGLSFWPSLVMVHSWLEDLVGLMNCSSYKVLSPILLMQVPTQIHWKPNNLILAFRENDNFVFSFSKFEAKIQHFFYQNALKNSFN